VTYRRFGIVVIVALVVGACSSGSDASNAPSQALAASAAASQLAAPASAAPSAAASASATSLHIAFFAASSANGFSRAVWQGIQAEAAKVGATATLYDGQFSSSVQLSQVEDATASGKFNGFAIVANDTVGIASAIQSAWQTAKIPTVTNLFPIGPNLQTLQPQVPGIIGTIARPPADGAKVQADSVVQFCQNINPCRVVILIGQLQYPSDKVRYDTYVSVLEQHSNIQVVALGQGNYDRDTSLKAMQDILQAHPQINAVLSNADQQTEGAVLALQAAGINPKSIFLTGAGATEAGVAAVRAGEWTNDLADYPSSMGVSSVDTLVKYYQGNTQPVVINEDSFEPFSPLLTKSILDANPSFIGQWKG
jgi:ribose transport system substrate-binding protein